jgi:hypothetical protein
VSKTAAVTKTPAAVPATTAPAAKKKRTYALAGAKAVPAEAATAPAPAPAPAAPKKPLRQQEVHQLSALDLLAQEKADGMYEIIVQSPWLRCGQGHGITCMNLPENRKFTVGKIAHQFGWGHNKQAFADHLRSLGVLIDKSDKASHPQGFVTSHGVYIYMKSIGWSEEQCRLALLQLDPFFGLADEAKKKAVEELKKKRRELQAEERKRKREHDAAVAAATPRAHCVDTDLNDDDDDDDDDDGAAGPMVVEVRAEEEPANNNAPKRARTQADVEAELDALRNAVVRAGNAVAQVGSLLLEAVKK